MFSWRPKAAYRVCAGIGVILAVASAASSVGGLEAAGDTPEVFTQVLKDWVTKYKIKQAVIVVRRGGRVVHRAGLGDGDDARPVLLGSLSKSITGACIATLVNDRKLTFDTPLAQALARFFKTNGGPADPRIERVTIAHLLTHRAGFSSIDDGDDAATGTTLKSYLESHSPREPPTPAYMATVFGRKLVRDPAKEFAYSNAGFLVLGAVIEEAAGRPYEDYCRTAALTPAGATGMLDPRWRILWSFGGWFMTGADYLAFLEQFDLTAPKLGTAMRDWMLERNNKTYGKTPYPQWYGPGLRLRDVGRGIEIWHTGSFHRQLQPDAQGPLSVNTSTLAFRIADGTSWFVHSTPLVGGGARNELHQNLLRVYSVVRKWE